jgi:hypothetical protein
VVGLARARGADDAVEAVLDLERELWKRKLLKGG